MAPYFLMVFPGTVLMAFVLRRLSLWPVAFLSCSTFLAFPSSWVSTALLESLSQIYALLSEQQMAPQPSSEIQVKASCIPQLLHSECP